MTQAHFEIRPDKIKAVSRPPEGPAAPFEHQGDLLGLVAGWPWLSKAPPLLLVEEKEPIYVHSVGGARTHVLGLSSRGRAVAVEPRLDAFVERMPAMKRMLRGLHRAGEHGAELGLPWPVSPSLPLTAILLGDGARFGADDKQVKKILKDFRTLVQEPGDRWQPSKNLQDLPEEDTRTPAWLKGLAPGRVQLLVLSVSRRLAGGRLVISSERLAQLVI